MAVLDFPNDTEQMAQTIHCNDLDKNHRWEVGMGSIGDFKSGKADNDISYSE